MDGKFDAGSSGILRVPVHDLRDGVPANFQHAADRIAVHGCRRQLRHNVLLCGNSGAVERRREHLFRVNRSEDPLKGLNLGCSVFVSLWSDGASPWRVATHFDENASLPFGADI